MKKLGVLPATVILFFSTLSFLGAQFTSEELAQRPQIEELLKKAKIVRSEDIGEGVTRPIKLFLKEGDVECSGCWKNPKGMKKGFLEGWQYEIAAYEIDKLLGLNLIPPTVEREFDGKKGSLQFWVTSEMSDLERIERGLHIPNDKLENWSKQKYLARAFDCLIANEDRTQQNIRYTKDWRTVLIDHSRSFRSSEKFRKQLVLGKNGLLAQKFFRRLSRAFVEKVRALNYNMIEEAVGPYLNKDEIEAILDRKVLLLDEIQEMIEKNGEENVLY